MKTIYQDEFVTLICGDCRNYVPAVFDHVVADPPYDDETHEGARSDLRPDYAVGFSSISTDLFNYVTGLQPRRWSLAFCSLEMLGSYRRAVMPERWVRAGVWDRVNGAPQFSGDRPAQGAEGIAIWHAPGRKRWNGGGRRAIWRHQIVRSVGSEQRVHETQKPILLMRELVLEFTDPGETVYDPCAGSGTTGVAAKEFGRRAVLVEIDPKNCDHAARRLEAAVVDDLAAIKHAHAKAKQLTFPMGDNQ